MAGRRVSKSNIVAIEFLCFLFDAGFALISLTGVGAVVVIILTVLAYVVIIIIFRLLGVKILSIKNIKSQMSSNKKARNRIFKKILSIIGEAIPFLDIIIPGYMLFAYYVYQDACEEDDAKAKASAESQANDRMNVPGRTPRRGSVSGSDGNRLQSRSQGPPKPERDNNSDRNPKKTKDRTPKRPEGKYNYGGINNDSAGIVA